MNIPILMYHQIDVPPPRGAKLRGLVVHPRSFAWQMTMLRLLGYRGLSMHDLEPYLSGEMSGKVVGLTFDDGYQNNLINALPILRKNGFTATCYGVSSQLGGSNVWDHALGILPKPLMSKAEWQQWLQHGMDVGSHTRTHADLNTLDQATALREIADSKTELESALQCEVRHFCYPYGRLNASLFSLVEQAGYKTATTTHRGKVRTGSPPYALNRIMIARACHPFLFAAKILTNYEDRHA
ncbi:polysaccharide deacetylase family protein [Rhodoferax sp. GW822-FHT02A01]|uniref:polysaccharide deacetylase family protein n=1 Tax=Rhodoferax sp. GW822-FHT02A01 TaxID=3141537 RepID=UPI00315DA6A6